MKSESGFTLLELMVALAIFATLAAAVMTAQQFVLGQGLRLEEKLMGAWVLDNRLTQLRLDGQPALGRRQFTVQLAGRAWQVTEAIEAAPEAGLLKVELAARRAGQPGSSVSLSSRLLQAPSAVGTP